MPILPQCVLNYLRSGRKTSYKKNECTFFFHKNLFIRMYETIGFGKKLRKSTKTFHFFLRKFLDFGLWNHDFATKFLLVFAFFLLITYFFHGKKWAFLLFYWLSICSRVCISKLKKNWKNDTPINLKNNENFTFEILKLPQGFDSPFFDFSNLSNQLLWI